MLTGQQEKFNTGIQISYNSWVLLLLNTKANGHNTISTSIEHANAIAKKEEDEHVRIVVD